VIARVRRVFLIVLAATAFGVAMSVLKGNGAGIRDDIGNLSAPWLLLPFLAGAAMRGRGLAGAAIGLAATCAGLMAFYVTDAFVVIGLIDPASSGASPLTPAGYDRSPALAVLLAFPVAMALATGVEAPSSAVAQFGSA
jgi:hypothetical protein